MLTVSGISSSLKKINMENQKRPSIDNSSYKDYPTPFQQKNLEQKCKKC